MSCPHARIDSAPEECSLCAADAERAPGETSATIDAWAAETFGGDASMMRMATRANEEMAELLRALSIEKSHAIEVADEVADVVIVLHSLVHRLGFDMAEVVDAKMQVNRQREWKLDETGHGYHVRVDR